MNIRFPGASVPVKLEQTIMGPARALETRFARKNAGKKEQDADH